MMLRKTIYFTISVGLFLSGKPCYAENKTLSDSGAFAPPAAHKLFSPIVSLQTWGTYSVNMEQNNEPAPDQQDIHFRRFRLGAKGQLNDWLKYSFQVHYDRLGENKLSATKGSSKNMFQIWNAYISARLLPSSELLYLHTGYYWAAISREYNTSPWAVSSFDKTYSVRYLRDFTTGKGNGIETGIGLGGLKNYPGKFGISYRLSAYQPKKFVSANYSNLLYSGRVMFSFGDPEQKKYKYMLTGNNWGKRQGVTVGLGGAYKGKTDNEQPGEDSVFFDRSVAFGSDLLIDYYGFRFDTEYFLMKRAASGYNDFNGTEWHARISYTFNWNRFLIEPAFLISKYSGEENGSELYRYTGNDTTQDFGINWYINKSKIKASLHYIIQDDEVSSNDGDYVGAALQIKI